MFSARRMHVSGSNDILQTRPTTEPAITPAELVPDQIRHDRSDEGQAQYPMEGELAGPSENAPHSQKDRNGRKGNSDLFDKYSDAQHPVSVAEHELNKIGHESDRICI